MHLFKCNDILKRLSFSIGVENSQKSDLKKNRKSVLKPQKFRPKKPRKSDLKKQKIKPKTPENQT